MFLDLKDGAKVISLKSFIPPDRKLTLRNINSIESTLRTREYAFGRDRCVLDTGLSEWA